MTTDLTVLIQFCNVGMVINKTGNVRISVRLRRLHLTTAALEKK